MRTSGHIVRVVALAVLVTLSFDPTPVYAEHDVSRRFGIGVYIAVVVTAMVTIVSVVAVCNLRRRVNPHTGLPSRTRKRPRRR